MEDFEKDWNAHLSKDENAKQLLELMRKDSFKKFLSSQFPATTPLFEYRESLLLPQQEHYKKEFDDCSELGEGNFGAVHEARSRRSSRLFAVKKYSTTSTWQVQKKNYGSNPMIFFRANPHPNLLCGGHAYCESRKVSAEDGQSFDELEHLQVVKNVEAVKEMFLKLPLTTVFIQSELCDMDLVEFLRIRDERHPSESLLSNAQQALEIAFDIALALEFMHSHSFVHRNIKPSNVFIGKERYKFTAKLGDLDIALNTNFDGPSNVLYAGAYCTTYNKNEVFRNGTASVIYSAPEMIESNQYTPSMDIYSLGLVFFETVSMFHTTSERIHCLQQARKGQLLDEMFILKDLIQLMIGPPQERPTIEDVLCGVKENSLTHREKKYLASLYSSVRSPTHPLFRSSPWLEEEFYEDNFEQLSLLGKGGFGEVHKVFCKKYGDIYAVKKQISKKIRHSETPARDAKTISQLKHPNIVECFSVWSELQSTGNKNQKPSLPDGDNPTENSIPSPSDGSSASWCSPLPKPPNIRLPEGNTDDDSSASWCSPLPKPLNRRLLQGNTDTTEEGDSSNKMHGDTGLADVKEIENLQNPNIELVKKLFMNFSLPKVHYIQMEFCDSGCLEKFLERRNGYPGRDVLTDEETQQAFKIVSFYIARAVEFMHYNTIMHRDIKRASRIALCVLLTREPIQLEMADQQVLYIIRTALESKNKNCFQNLRNAFWGRVMAPEGALPPSNVLLVKASGTMIAKLGDFGFACGTGDTSKFRRYFGDNYESCEEDCNHVKGIGTPPYAAPEQLLSDTYSSSVDIFSLGLLILETFSLFASRSEKAQCFEKAKTGQLPESIPLKELLLRMLGPPKQRPVAEVVLLTVNEARLPNLREPKSADYLYHASDFLMLSLSAILHHSRKDTGRKKYKKAVAMFSTVFEKEMYRIFATIPEIEYSFVDFRFAFGLHTHSKFVLRKHSKPDITYVSLDSAYITDNFYLNLAKKFMENSISCFQQVSEDSQSSYLHFLFEVSELWNLLFERNEAEFKKEMVGLVSYLSYLRDHI